MTRKVNAMLVGLLAVVVAAGGAFVISAQSAKGDERQDEKTKYRSSVQTADDNNEKAETEENEGAEDNESRETSDKAGENESEAEDQAEVAESARLQSLATISADQAKSAALAQVAGTVTKVELENEDGNVVYGVEIKTADGERDVKVDAGNGSVLHVEKGDGEDDDND